MRGRSLVYLTIIGLLGCLAAEPFICISPTGSATCGWATSAAQSALFDRVPRVFNASLRWRSSKPRSHVFFCEESLPWIPMYLLLTTAALPLVRTRGPSTPTPASEFGAAKGPGMQPAIESS